MLRHAFVLLAGCGFTPGVVAERDGAVDVAPDAMVGPSTLFVSDYERSRLHRYRASRTLAPEIDLTLVIPGAVSPMILPATGELLVSELLSARIDRYSTPLATPVFSGAITGAGVTAATAKMATVDSELWIVTPLTASVTRLAFDASGGATNAGNFGHANGRGIVFDPVRRQLWLSQCCGTDTIRSFTVEPDRDVVELTPITSGGLANPHGMVMTPWGELLVANHGGANILRYTIDANGSATFAGAITGSEIVDPIDLALSPWGELFVTNFDAGTVARMQFNAAHEAMPLPSVQIPDPGKLSYLVLVNP